MQKIIKVGIARNDAVHGDLKVKNIDLVIKQCDEVLEIIAVKTKLDQLKKKIRFELEIFHYFDKENKIIIDDELGKWIDTVNTLNIRKIKNIDKLKEVLAQSESRLNKIRKYASKYIWEQRKNNFKIIVDISIVLGVVYILFKVFS